MGVLLLCGSMDVDMKKITKIVAAHVLIVLLNQCVMNNVRSGMTGFIRSEGIDIMADYCEGCYTYTREVGCNNETEQKDGDCPCSICIVKVMCRTGCEEFAHFLENDEYVKKILGSVKVHPGTAGFRIIAGHIRKSGMTAYEYIKALKKFTIELGIRNGKG